MNELVFGELVGKICIAGPAYFTCKGNEILSYLSRKLRYQNNANSFTKFC